MPNSPIFHYNCRNIIVNEVIVLKRVYSRKEIETVIEQEQLSLIYVSHQGCSVCHSLLPQIERVLEDYPLITSIHVDSDEVKEVAGLLTVFTVPAVLVFSKGRELFRKAHFVPIEELRQQLAKYSQALN